MKSNRTDMYGIFGYSEYEYERENIIRHNTQPRTNKFYEVRPEDDYSYRSYGYETKIFWDKLNSGELDLQPFPNFIVPNSAATTSENVEKKIAIGEENKNNGNQFRMYAPSQQQLVVQKVQNNEVRERNNSHYNLRK